MRAVIYTSSAPRTDIIDQHAVLSQYAEQHTMKIVRSYSDLDIWNKPAKSLTGLQGVLRSAEEKVMEIVLVHDLALLGVNLAHTLNTIQVLAKHKVGVTFYKQCMTTHGESGLETLKVLTDLSECESVKFSNRIRAGMRNAEFNGVRLGRPSIINDSVEACVLALRERGMSVAHIAKTAKIGVGTAYRIIREREAPDCV